MQFIERQYQTTARLTESNGGFKWRKTEIMGLQNMCLYSEVCSIVDIWLMQPWPNRKPVWFLLICLSRLLDNWRRSSDAMLIPRWFLYECVSLFLYVDTITDSHQSLGIVSIAQINPRNFVNSILEEGWRRSICSSFLIPFKRTYFTDHLHFGLGAGIHLHWFTCGHKWRVHCSHRSGKLRPKFFCPTHRVMILR